MSKAAAILFRTPVWFSLKSDPTVGLLLKPLSFKDIHGALELSHTISDIDDIDIYHTTQQTIINAIQDSRNAHGFSSLQQLVKQLPAEDVADLVTKLYTISMFTPSIEEDLAFCLDIQFDDRFDENWECSACQTRKLQSNRACGMIPEEQRSKEFSIKVNGKRYHECPIYLMDGFLVSQAAQSHKLFMEGILPEEGGAGEQTHFFIKSAQQLEARIKRAERDMLEESRNKRS